jgi:hypothetical protein
MSKKWSNFGGEFKMKIENTVLQPSIAKIWNVKKEVALKVVF